MAKLLTDLRRPAPAATSRTSGRVFDPTLYGIPAESLCSDEHDCEGTCFGSRYYAALGHFRRPMADVDYAAYFGLSIEQLDRARRGRVEEPMPPASPKKRRSTRSA